MPLEFKFGRYPELAGILYGEHYLEALIYDAYKGVNLSNHLILGYFSSHPENTPKPILEFIRSRIADVQNSKTEKEKEEKAKQFFSPRIFGKQGSKTSPAINDLVLFLARSSRGNGKRGETNIKAITLTPNS